MNYDELAFFNQQLAAMLRDGMPLEGALRQLCAGMKKGSLRVELQRLEQDLARGLSLKEALSSRQLPEFYRRMLEVGSRSQDLPEMLTLIADHYHRVNTVWNRLKGLMVYPLIVIVVSLALTACLSLIFRRYLWTFFEQFGISLAGSLTALWAPPVLLAIVAAFGVAAVVLPASRAWLRWHLPAFREASLSQLASIMAVMLKSGIPLPEALALAENLESGTSAGRALARWRHLVEDGLGKPTQWPQSLPPFPPMFLWLVHKGGEDLAGGFQKAAGIYQARASYRIEMALYGALPVSVLLLGQMVLWQAVPMFRSFVWLMNSLGGE